MKAQIKNQDADYLKTMIEDLYSSPIARQVKIIRGEFCTVEYEGFERVEKAILSLVADLNNEAVPAFETRGEEMLAELKEINEDLEAKTLKLKIDFEVKQALRKILSLTFEPGVGMTELRKKINSKINSL